MQEKLTTEIFEQIDCIKVHLRNLQTVAEIEKMLPVSCDELHKAIAEMEKSVVHLMNFEKLLKGKRKDKRKDTDSEIDSDVLTDLNSAVFLEQQVLIVYNSEFMKGVKEVNNELYEKISKTYCWVRHLGVDRYGLVYGKDILAFTKASAEQAILKVKLVF